MLTLQTSWCVAGETDIHTPPIFLRLLFDNLLASLRRQLTMASIALEYQRSSRTHLFEPGSETRWMKSRGNVGAGSGWMLMDANILFYLEYGSMCCRSIRKRRNYNILSDFLRLYDGSNLEHSKELKKRRKGHYGTESRFEARLWWQPYWSHWEIYIYIQNIYVMWLLMTPENEEVNFREEANDWLFNQHIVQERLLLAA